jgi:hypothetical protein
MLCLHIVVFVNDDMAKSRQSLIKTACGNKVKSQSERKIDDWLYRNGWISIYEPKIVFSNGCETKPDWVLLPQNDVCKPIIVEYWGLSVLKPNASYWAKEAQPAYQKRRAKKEQHYESHRSYHYIGLEMPDLKRLDEALGKRLDELKCESGLNCECIHIVDSQIDK